MYSQGSYNPYQQRPPGLPPPPPPPHFQQVPLAAAVPPHIAQPGPTIYQHGPPPPPPVSKSYLHPPPSVHGSTSLPHMYSTAQQNSQYHSHLGTQNVHHIPQSVPPPPPPPPSIGTPRPDMLQAPPPSRVLPPPPPPPSQGQTSYRAPVLPVPQPPGGVQGLQHIPPPPPPPPPTSSFLTSSQYGNFVQSTSGNSHLPPLAPPPPPPLLPPPPPSSPPPVPPSPPPISSTSLLNASYNSDTSSNRVSGSKLRTSDFVDKAVALTQDGHKPPVRDGGTSDSPLRPLGIESSKQPDHTMAAGGSHSPVDSDMEMEGQSN